MRSFVKQLPYFVVAAFIAIGVAAVWVMVVGIATDAIVERLFGRGDTEDILVRSDEIVIHSHLNRSDGPVNTYRFADGRPVALDDVQKWENGEWLTPSSFVGPLERESDFAPPSWEYRLARFWFSGRDQSRWYLVHDGLAEGHVYFVGYDTSTKERVGYLGKTGFAAMPPPKEQLFSYDGRRLVSRRFTSAVISKTNSGHPDPVTRHYVPANLPEWSVYFLSGDELWHVDLRHHTATLQERFPGAIDLELAPPPTDGLEAPGGIDEKLMVRTGTEMIKIALDGEVLHRWSLPEDARDKELIYWYDVGDDNALVRFIRRAVNRHLEEELVWLNADGGVRRRETVELLGGGLEPHEVWTMSPALPMPTVLTFAFCAFAGEVRGPDFSSKFAKAVALFWPALLLVYLVSAVLAWLAYRRQVRFSLPAPGVWAVFVFLFGVPGWLAYRWHRRWPVLETCGECRRPAPRDRDTCAACGHLFAAPPRVGTEVFA